MKQLVIIFLLLSGGVLRGQQAPPDEAIHQLNMGIDFYSAQKFTDAVRAYTSAISHFPSYFKAYYYRSQAHLQLNDHANALRDMEKAAQINPNNEQLYGIMASIYYQQNQFQSVVEIVRIAEEMQVADHVCYLHRGLVYMDRGMDKFAKSDFNRAIQLNPEVPETFYNRGVLRASEENPELAIQDFSVALQYRRNYHNARIARAKANFKLDNFEDALDDLHLYLASNVEDGDAYKLRGHTFYALKRYSQAIADYNLALHYFPMNKDILYQRAGAYMSTKKYQEAIGDLTILLEQDGPEARRYLERGYCFAKISDHPSAIDDYNAAIGHQPEYLDAYFYRGQSYLVLKNYEQGCNDLLFARKKGHIKAVEIMKEHCKRNK